MPAIFIHILQQNGRSGYTLSLAMSIAHPPMQDPGKDDATPDTEPERPGMREHPVARQVNAVLNGTNVSR